MNEPTHLDIYLNDHLAGSVGAVEIAKRCAAENAGSDLGQFLDQFLDEVEEDRRTLEGLMDAIGTARNPVKQAGAWLAEKVSRLKLGTEAQELSNLLSIETLCMGVEGKILLWTALREVSSDHEALSGIDFDQLTERARAQKDGLEQHRLELVRSALGAHATV
ncbi:MAG: hypothetical protein ACRDYV_11730 [Acidimicrobiia bacterium]